MSFQKTLNTNNGEKGGGVQGGGERRTRRIDGAFSNPVD